MQEWNGAAQFDDLVQPILSAIRFAYSLRRKNRDKNIPYDGYDRPSILHVCPSVTETFSSDYLTEVEEDQGRTALDEIIAVAVQIGIEQGRRLEKAENKKIFSRRLSDSWPGEACLARPVDSRMV